VYDPFLGTGTISVAAALCGRNSAGSEVDTEYFAQSVDRLRSVVNADAQSTLYLSA
ncbi:MAG: DNA methyltransferase, partial [Acidimicrobiales bacterium]